MKVKPLKWKDIQIVLRVYAEDNKSLALMDRAAVDRLLEEIRDDGIVHQPYSPNGVQLPGLVHPERLSAEGALQAPDDQDFEVEREALNR